MILRKYISILIACLMLISCEDKITLDVPEGVTKLVIDGTLKSTESVQKITISTTNEYFSNQQAPRVSNAVVDVSTSDGNKISFVENSVVKGQYEATMTLDSNVEYTLNVVTSNGKTYKSFSESLLRVAPIDSIYQTDSTTGSDDEDAFRKKGYVVRLSTVETPGVGDYYRWIIYINGEKEIDPFNLNLVEDTWYDGNLIIDWDIVFETQPGDTVLIEQMSISKRAFNFWSLVQQQLSNFGGPFDTPPAPIEGNIFNVNDANETVLGFFGVSKVSKKSIIIEEREK